MGREVESNGVQVSDMGERPFVSVYLVQVAVNSKRRRRTGGTDGGHSVLVLDRSSHADSPA